jgi:hypothetical protein
LRAPAFARWRVIAALLAVLFLAGHLPFLPVGLEDIDSTNFALGLRDFDVADHRPHPPGYPVYIAIGKVGLGLIEKSGVAAERNHAGREALALALLAVFAGALAVFPLLRFFRALESNDRRALAAAVLTLACPMFWFTAGRPMSDVPGLAAALVALALAAVALERLRAEGVAPARDAETAPALPAGFDAADWLTVAAAFVAGLAIGVRTQTLWFTVPLVTVALAYQLRRQRRVASLAAVGAFAAGALLWFVPLLAASGTPENYFRALKKQGLEDWTDVDLLATQPTARKFIIALINTFVAPWAHPALGAGILLLALVGAGALWGKSRFAFGALILVLVPYAIVHLLFQEAVTTRYALPFVPVVAYFAVSGLDTIWPRGMPFVGAGLSAVCLVLSAPTSAVYAREGSPLVRALHDLKGHPVDQAAKPVLAMHHVFAVSLREEPLPFRRLDSPRTRESLVLTQHWLGGGAAPVWFLADPRRTDLALVDHASRRLVSRYRWAFASERFMSGVRPNEVDWYAIDPPGWFATDGWSLTPELAGIVERDRTGLARGPIRAYVRRRDDSAVMMIGGRHLGAPGDPDGRLTVSIDGRPVAQWAVTAKAGFFLQKVMLPAGSLSGSGTYAELQVSSQGASPPVAIEQFDLQPTDRVVYGFDTGWHEQEYDPATGRTWRWASENAHLLIHPGDGDVQLRLRAENPLVYFDTPPTVSIKAGASVLATMKADRDLNMSVRVPADVMKRAEGRVTVQSSEQFVPAELSSRTGDRRRLALRCFAVEITRASGPRTEASFRSAYPSSAAAALR